MTVVSTATPPSIPSIAANETIAPTGAWTGAPGFSRLRYRANGVTENAANAQAGTATEPSNTSADNGSATTASTAIAIAAAIAPPSSPQPRVAIMIGKGARYASVIARRLDWALTANKSAAAHPAPMATTKRCNMTSAVPRWPAVRRGSPAHLHLPPQTSAAGSKFRRDDARGSLADHVGQEAQKPRALDRLGELALLAGADRRDARGHDLAALGDVARQQANVLVVDLRRACAGKRARLAAAKKRSAGGASHQNAPAGASSRGRRGGRSPRSPRSPRSGRSPRGPRGPRSSRSLSSRLRSIADGPASCSSTRMVR